MGTPKASLSVVTYCPDANRVGPSACTDAMHRTTPRVGRERRTARHGDSTGDGTRMARGQYGGWHKDGSGDSMGDGTRMAAGMAMEIALGCNRYLAL